MKEYAKKWRDRLYPKLEKMLGFIKKWYMLYILFAAYMFVDKVIWYSRQRPYISSERFESLYRNDYRNGLCCQGFIGSIYGLFFRGYTTINDVLRLNRRITYLCMVLLIFILMLIYKSSQEKVIKRGIIFLSTLFCLLPSFSVLCSRYLMELDCYLVLMLLISILVLHSKSRTEERYILVLILGIIGVLINHAYFFTYFVPVLVILCWMIMEAENPGKELCRVAWLVVFPLGLFTGYMIFMTRDMAEVLALIKPGISSDLCFYLLRFLPVFFALLFYWHYVFSHTKELRRKKYYGMMNWMYLLFVPMFLFTGSYRRWMAALTFTVFMQLFYMLYKRDEATIKLFSTLNKKWENYVNRKNVFADWMEEYSLMLCIFFFLVVLGWLMGIHLDSPEYNLSTYLLNYSDGFGSRLLVGSFLQLFFHNITQDLVRKVNYLCLLLNDLLISYVLFCLYKSWKGKEQTGVAGYFILLFLSMPGTGMYIGTVLGRLDIYILLFATLAICFLQWERLGTFRYILSTICCVLAILTHQVFILTFFVPVFVALLWQVVRENFSRKTVLCSVGIVLVPTILFFLYIQFFAHLQYTTLEKMVEIVSTRTTDGFSETMLKLEYLSSFKENFIDLGLNRFIVQWRRILFKLIELLPLWGMCGLFWWNMAKNAQSRKEKWSYILMQAGYLVYVPLFLFTIDYGRWFNMMEISAMVGVMIPMSTPDYPAVHKTMQNMKEIFQKYDYLAYILCGYLLALKYHYISI